MVGWYIVVNFALFRVIFYCDLIVILIFILDLKILEWLCFQLSYVSCVNYLVSFFSCVNLFRVRGGLYSLASSRWAMEAQFFLHRVSLHFIWMIGGRNQSWITDKANLWSEKQVVYVLYTAVYKWYRRYTLIYIHYIHCT